ncbi:MAG: hypothetical protein NT062_27175 [Proteobacteria bacterium]|nr:hypothetical protein [Pseudomonadota bacterium]
MRYAHSDGTVWSIEQQDKQLVIETGGKQSVRKFVSAAHAEVQLAKLVGDKLAAGFSEAAPVERTPDPPAAPPDDLDPALVAQIVADPYDAAAFAVLADELMRRDDPRGELCARMAAAEAKPTRKARAAVEAWLVECADVLLGGIGDLLDLGAYDEEPLIWRHGFLHRAKLDFPAPSELAQILAHPSSRFLVELELHGATPELVAVLASHPLPALRVLELQARRDVGDLGPVWTAMPQLRRVRVVARAFTVGALALPHAERVELVARILPASVVHAVTAAAWPMLERLTLRFGGFRTFQRDTPRGDDAATFDDVRPLLARADLPKLTHLRLVRGFAAPSAVAIATGPLAAQLVALDLSGDSFDDRAAFLIAQERARFGKLKEIVVMDNALSPAGRVALSNVANVVDKLEGIVLGDHLDTLQAIDVPMERNAGWDPTDDDRYDDVTE